MEDVSLNIQGFQKTTLLDYPKHVAATIFFGGCNFRCPFCHNGGLVQDSNTTTVFSPEEILTYLKKRKNVLDGVCITGGEPTLQKNLSDFLEKIKQLGLFIKLDTNGYQPQVLKDLCTKGLIDYVAMDIKGSPEKYASICGLEKIDFSKIQESVTFLKTNTIDYEFRTTVTKELHLKDDFEKIGTWLTGAKAYYLQGYQDAPQVISHTFTAYTMKELTIFQQQLQNYIPTVEIRGVTA